MKTVQFLGGFFLILHGVVYRIFFLIIFFYKEPFIAENPCFTGFTEKHPNVL